MFFVELNGTFSGEVEITIPGKEKAKAKFEFRYMPKKAIQELLNEAAAENPNKDEVAIVSRFLAGWSDFSEPFSPEALRKFLDYYPLAFSELVLGYAALVLGQREKNS